MVTLRCAMFVMLASAAIPGSLAAQMVSESREPTVPTDAKSNASVKVMLEADIVFSEMEDLQLKLDVAIPKNGKGPYPTILVFHGIGPTTKGRAGMRDYILALAEKGFAAVAVGFRHESKHAFPAAYDDAFAALTWVQKNADQYGFDSNRVGALGFSGGGGLAMMLGAKKSDCVRAVVTYYAPSDFTLFHERAEGLPGFFLRLSLEQWLGGAPDKVADKFRQASPISFVHKNVPSHLLIHGAADKIVPVEQSKVLVQKMKEVGAKASLITLENAGHNFDDVPGLNSQIAAHATELFFLEHLGQPRVAENRAAAVGLRR